MSESRDERLKKLIEAKKNKSQGQSIAKGSEFNKIGNQMKGNKNKKSGGLFDK